MPALKFIHRLERIDQLIKLQSTGNTKELAEKLEISDRQVLRYIANLKELGADIKFDKLRNSYVYVSKIELFIGYK